jgi:rfaE bifunctional protein nucleotidyltransferase chain/domain
MAFHNLLSSKIISQQEISRFVNAKRFTGKRIVFTNGCFDILHAGHVDYLTQARDLGDILVLGLNTDESVKRLNKGPERPINNQDARAKVLAGLGCVDAIILFNEDTPYELINLVQPDVLVKGDDYKPEAIVGYDIVTARGGKVVTIPFLQGFSTTNIVNKLKG